MPPRPTWYAGGARVTRPPDGTAGVAVFIHGLGGSADFLAAPACTVSRQLPTLTFDLPGHGQDRHDHLHVASFEEYVDRTESVLADQGVPDIERVLFVGHSLGGFISLELARRRGRGDGVVLIDGICFTLAESLGMPFARARRSTGLRMAAFGRMVAAAASVPVPVAVMARIARHRALRVAVLWPYLARPAHVPVPELDRALHLAGTTAVWRNLRHIRTADFAAMTQGVGPCILLGGAADRFMTPADFEKVERELDVRRRVTVPGSGHWVMFDSPSRFTAELEHAVGELRAAWSTG